ncbi:hypothetical protein [Ferruginibacter sp.]
MIADKQKLAHPAFILSVLLLITNDWLFKVSFHNFITGKLSDFAGLFAFPFFLSTVFPRLKKPLHVFTGVLFIFWKSDLSQPIINLLNSIYIPVNRTIDFGDNIALISVIFSYIFFNTCTQPYIAKPIFIKVIAIVSCIAFMATSVPPRDLRKFIAIDKEYPFNFSKRELLSRLNSVQLKEINQANKVSGQVDFDSETNVFHFHGETDTLALILDYEKIKDTDTVRYKTSFVEIMITGNDNTSMLKLVSIYYYVPKHKEKDFRDKAITVFEKWVVKKIKKSVRKNKL